MKKNLILGLFLTSVLLMSVVGVSAQEITGDVVITGNAVNTGYACSKDSDCTNAGKYSSASACSGNDKCACAAGSAGEAKTCWTPTPSMERPVSSDTRSTLGKTDTTTSTGTRTPSSTGISDRTSTRTGTPSASARKSSACPRGWDTLTDEDNFPCCRKAENTGRGLLRGRFLGKLFE